MGWLKVPPPLCESNTETPKSDGKNTYRCCDKGGGGIYEGKSRTWCQSCGNNTCCCCDKGVALARGLNMVRLQCLH